MTMSSLSLASIQGTVSCPVRNRINLFLVFANEPREELVKEPADGFRMETILLAFVSFLPSSFKNPCPPEPLFLPGCFIASKKDYISFLLFLSILFFLFFRLFFSRPVRSPGPPQPRFGAQRNKTYHTSKNLSICPVSFLSLFFKKKRFCCDAH